MVENEINDVASPDIKYEAAIAFMSVDKEEQMFGRFYYLADFVYWNWNYLYVGFVFAQLEIVDSIFH